MRLRHILLLESVPNELLSLKPQIALVAQRVYDSWDEEDEDTYAGGGICHLISDAIVDFLYSKGTEATSFSCSVGENHVMVACNFDGDTYIIDISPYVYETGSGYRWNKIKGVKFSPSDVDISYSTEDFSSYYEDW